MKKLCMSVFLLLSFIFVVGCQDKSPSYNGNKNSKYSYDKNKTYPERANPPKEEESCDKKNGKKECQDKSSCANDQSLQEEQKVISSKEEIKEKEMPLEELKASIENQIDSFEITENENQEYNFDE